VGFDCRCYWAKKGNCVHNFGLNDLGLTWKRDSPEARKERRRQQKLQEEKEQQDKQLQQELKPESNAAKNPFSLAGNAVVDEQEERRMIAEIFGTEDDLQNKIEREARKKRSLLAKAFEERRNEELWKCLLVRQKQKQLEKEERRKIHKPEWHDVSDGKPDGTPPAGTPGTQILQWDWLEGAEAWQKSLNVKPVRRKKRSQPSRKPQKKDPRQQLVLADDEYVRIVEHGILRVEEGPCTITLKKGVAVGPRQKRKVSKTLCDLPPSLEGFGIFGDDVSVDCPPVSFGDDGDDGGCSLVDLSRGAGRYFYLVDDSYGFPCTEDEDDCLPWMQDDDECC